MKHQEQPGQDLLIKTCSVTIKDISTIFQFNWFIIATHFPIDIYFEYGLVNRIVWKLNQNKVFNKH